MPRTVNCNENAVAERFFWSLKHAWTNHRVYADLESVRVSVFNCIEMFYSERRRHDTLEYISPNEYGLQFHMDTTDASEDTTANAAVTAI